MELLFWTCSVAVVYIYIGYPLLLKLLPKSPLKSAQQPKTTPAKTITILIPAFNEANGIEATINNKLELNYPSELIQILVISDESDDGTDEIVQAISKREPRVKLIRQSPRQGKTSGLNLAIPEATGEIVVFSDANSHYQADALQKLVNNFEDDCVGYVTGKMVYVNKEGSLVGDGCSAYMKYENYMRRLETEIGSVVGVDGGIDAIRKSLYQDMNADQLPDFVLPLKVVTQGKRVIFCEEALLHEEALNTATSEFRMRVRVSLRAYWAMWDMQHLFNPRKYGLFALQLTSHKLMRYLAFIPLVISFLTNGFITGHGGLYQLLFIGQISFYGAATFVAFNESTHNRYLGLAHYFCLINIASAMAFSKFLKGEKITVWKPRVG